MTMSVPYLSITKKGKKAYLAVDMRRGTPKLFDLNESGCKKAGRYLHSRKVENWLNSSDVDHAEKYGFDADVRTLVNDGWNASSEEAERPRREVLRLVFRHCDGHAFQAVLSPGEKKAYAELKEMAEL
jgi:hypothetical protein